MSMQPRRVVTTEQTAKRFKAIMLAGGAGLFVSLGLALSAMSITSNDRLATALLTVAGVIAACSAVVYGVGRVLAWWHHG